MEEKLIEVARWMLLLYVFGIFTMNCVEFGGALEAKNSKRADSGCLRILGILLLAFLMWFAGAFPGVS